MSENEKTNETVVCRKSSDLHTFCIALHTFCIALLTAIVVVAVYHVGNRMCRIFCSAPATCDRPAVTYMLVPVPAAGAPAMGCHRGMPPCGGHPKFARGNRHPGRKCFNPGPGPEGMKPCCRKAMCDAPAPKPCCGKKAVKPVAATACPKAAVKPADATAAAPEAPKAPAK